jgi:hypothetical protein
VMRERELGLSTGPDGSTDTEEGAA